MTASYQYLIDTGEIAADTADLLADVQAEFRSAFGASINLSSATPQGALVTAETLARTNVMKSSVERANVINPNLSFGVFLDAVCSFNGVKRGANTSTTARNVRVYGNPTTVIPAGSRVETDSGDVFTILVATTIPVQGTTMLTIASVAYGDIALPVGTLKIIDGTIGWGSIVVDSGTIRTPGTVRLTDAQLKNARRVRLATYGSGSTPAIIANVSAVPNVTSVMVVENNTGTTGVHGGVTFSLPNSIWVCVAGNPLVQDVADALYAAHAGGCPWEYGATGNGVPAGGSSGIPVNDPISNVRYFVKYTTPIMYDAYVKVVVKQGTSSTSPVEGIQNTMVDYANGNIEGEAGFVVGASVSAFELGGAVSATLPGLYIRSVQVACVLAGQPAPAPGDYSGEKVLGPFEQAQLAFGNVQVTVE